MSHTPSEFDHLRSRLELHPDARLVLNGQPMILLPRHLFRYILREVRAAAGSPAFERIFRTAGHDGAVTFCRRFQEIHGCTPREAVEGYLKEMSLRGWGHFEIARLEPGYLEVLLRHSALGAEADLPSGNLIWEGAMLGALEFLEDTPAEEFQVAAQEIAGEGNHPPKFHIVVSRKGRPTGA